MGPTTPLARACRGLPPLALGAVLALLCPAAARADWEGRLKIHTEPPGARGEADQEGKISGKGGKLRFDTARPPMGAMAAIFDLKAKKAVMLIEERKAYMTMDLDRPPRGAGGGGPRVAMSCKGDDPVECLKENGYAKTGAETVNGQKATRWERDREEGPAGKVHQTLWVPEGSKEIALVRQVSKSAERTVTLDVLDFKKTSLPDSHFAVPEGYQEMSGMMGGPGMGGPGMGPGEPGRGGPRNLKLPPGVKLPPGTQLPPGVSVEEEKGKE